MKTSTYMTSRTVTLSRLEYEELQLAKVELAYLKFNKRCENFINTKVTESFNLWSEKSTENKFQQIVNYLFTTAVQENSNAIVVSSNFLDWLASNGNFNGKYTNTNEHLNYGRWDFCEKMCIKTFGHHDSDGIEYIGYLSRNPSSGIANKEDKSIETTPILNIFVGDYLIGDCFLVLANSKEKVVKRKSPFNCTFNSIKKYQISCTVTINIKQLDLRTQFNKNAELLAEVKAHKKYLTGGDKWKRLK